jgi:hypothetical protein
MLDSDTSRLVVGDDFDVIRDLPNFTFGSIEKAWLTIKASEFDSDDDAAIQKEITKDAQPGIGQINNDGSDSSGTAELVFQLTAVETAMLSAYTQYVYDIQIADSNGKLSTIESGILAPMKQITQSTS